MAKIPVEQRYSYDLCFPTGENLAIRPPGWLAPMLSSPVLSYRQWLALILGRIIPIETIARLPVTETMRKRSAATCEEVIAEILNELGIRESVGKIVFWGEAGSFLEVSAASQEEANAKIAELRARINQLLKPFKRKMQLRIVRHKEEPPL